MGNGALGLQRMTESCQRQAKVLAVTSGKGGVGKSNIAANLAICLIRKQKLLHRCQLWQRNWAMVWLHSPTMKDF